MKSEKNSNSKKNFGKTRNSGGSGEQQRGAALAIAVIVVAILAVVALTALTFASTEARIAGSDLQRTQAFYAAASGIEKMTHDFSNLFRSKMRPTAEDLDTIEKAPPTELKSVFNSSSLSKKTRRG